MYVLRLASRTAGLVLHLCCVNALFGPPALWQPQVRPPPASHAVRLEWVCFEGGGNTRLSRATALDRHR